MCSGWWCWSLGAFPCLLLGGKNIIDRMHGPNSHRFSQIVRASIAGLCHAAAAIRLHRCSCFHNARPPSKCALPLLLVVMAEFRPMSEHVPHTGQRCRRAVENATGKCACVRFCRAIICPCRREMRAISSIRWVGVDWTRQCVSRCTRTARTDSAGRQCASKRNRGRRRTCSVWTTAALAWLGWPGVRTQQQTHMVSSGTVTYQSRSRSM